MRPTLLLGSWLWGVWQATISLSWEPGLLLITFSYRRRGSTDIGLRCLPHPRGTIVRHPRHHRHFNQWFLRLLGRKLLRFQGYAVALYLDWRATVRRRSYLPDLRWLCMKGRFCSHCGGRLLMRLPCPFWFTGSL